MFEVVRRHCYSMIGCFEMLCLKIWLIFLNKVFPNLQIIQNFRNLLKLNLKVRPLGMKIAYRF